MAEIKKCLGSVPLPITATTLLAACRMQIPGPAPRVRIPGVCGEVMRSAFFILQVILKWNIPEAEFQRH